MSSRKTLLTRGVIIGYGALVTQIFYSLASIPLALSYLSKEQFGLWSLITTLTGYLQLLEFGMTNAFGRHLMECRDTKEDGRYGRHFVAGLFATGLAALLILLLGTGGSLIIAPVFEIPHNLRDDFQWLMIGNVLIATASVAIRMFGIPLYIHQRHDLIQLSQIGVYVVLYAVLYYGLHAGWGIYAMLANAGAGFAWSLVFGLVSCSMLKFYPPKGTWKRPHRGECLSVLRYSRDLFVVQIGTQLANSMPMLLMPRLLGLEAAGTWAVCTRPFNILRQAVGKPCEYSLPMLCEMYVKGETRRMALRWTHVTQLVTAVAACIFSVGAANNHTFISLWVGQHMAWSTPNDWLAAFFFLTNLLVYSLFGVVGFRKHFGHIRYAPFVETALIALNAWWMTPLWGIGGLLGAAIISQILVRLSFGLHHLAYLSETHTRWLFCEALLRPLLVMPLSAAAAIICAQLHTLLPGYAGLLLAASTGTLLSGVLVFFLGVSADVRNEMLQMLIKPLAKWTKLKTES
jgi:O-antigen/teichoic acid export membrane protein